MAYCTSTPIKPELTANTVTTVTLRTKAGLSKQPVKARLWEGGPLRPQMLLIAH